jgi:hypothetical protein
MALLKRVRVASVCLTLLSASSLASAQEEPAAADVQAARELGKEGVKLAEAGICVEAVDKLQRAEKLFHAIPHLAYMGECQIKLGKFVEATETLNRAMREVLAPNAPAAFFAAQEKAKKLYEDARPKVAKLKIAVAAPADAKLLVKVDGEPLNVANLNVNRPMSPGEHKIEASAPGFLTAEAKVNLPEGGTDSVALTLQVDPNAPKEPVPTVAPSSAGPSGQTPAQPSAPSDNSKPNFIPAYVAGGVGAVGLGVGIIFGAVALGKKGDLDESCKDKVCPANAQDSIDSAKSSATVSTVGFVVGGLGLAAGAYLYLRPPTIKAGSARIVPSFGLGHIGAHGQF